MITPIIKKTRWLLSFVLLSAGLVPIRTTAQSGPADDDVKTLLAKVQQAYRQADHLSFRMSYVYANAGQSGMPADSLQGEVQLDKDRSRFVIDNTETMVTGKYAIRILDEERSIYLSGKGKNVTPLPDLLGMTDSLLAHLKGMTMSVQHQGALQVLAMKFPPGEMYSYISLTVDPLTGYLQQAVYAVHTADLVGKEMVESPGHAGAYQPEGLISVFFSNYEHNRFSDGLFDESKIFAHVAGRYQPVGQYKDYHIFLASTNL